MIPHLLSADLADEEFSADFSSQRTPPHSIDAEQGVLSICVLDGADMIARCIESKIRPCDFHDQNHGIIFQTLLEMHSAKIPIEAATLAQELKDRRRLEQIGGTPFLGAATSTQPTSATATHFITKVKEFSILRQVIRETALCSESAYALPVSIPEFAADVRRRFEDILTSTVSTGYRMDWDELLAFDSQHDQDCLMGNRFLGRTGAAVIVAPSGVGKSVLGFQIGACAALKRHFFSLKMHLAMRVLYIQSEDDFGDVAESVQGFVRGYDVTPSELAQLKTRFRIERWNDVAGSAFLARLRRAYATWPYDLVIINPLFSFAGCNISEQRELSPFLRNGLNPILNETRSSGIIIHHTNKPPQDVSAQDSATNAELRYLGSGSAELTNWARAYITLQGVRAAGDHIHKMVFVKRGNRAGLINDKGEHTNSVFIQHSTTGLCWLPSDYTPESTGGKFTPVFNLAKALTIFDSAKPWGQNEILIARDQSMSVRAVRYHRREIEENGL